MNENFYSAGSLSDERLLYLNLLLNTNFFHELEITW